MSTELFDQIAIAESRGDDALVAALDAVEPPSVVRVAWVLSVALAADVATLEAVVSQAWPEEPRVHDAVAALIEWPFIEITRDGYRLSDSASLAFREEFLDREPVAFARVHALFAELEEGWEADSEPDDDWFARGRVAYYLAGVEPGRAVDMLGDGFAAPPDWDRTGARLWLSWIALRQSWLMPEQQREVAFFRGFEAYVAGRRTEASRQFDAVVGHGDTDRYEALALHLSGVLRRRGDADGGIQRLRDSVALSESLGLVENEVMARSSLVTSLDVRSGAGDLDEAFDLADLNLVRAREYALSPAFLLRARLVKGAAEKMRLEAAARDWKSPRALHLIDDLRQLWHEALQEEPETAGLAVNYTAQVLSEVRDRNAALAEVDEYLSVAAHIPFSVLTRLGKSVGSMLRDAPPSAAESAKATLARIESAREQRSRWLRGLPPSESLELA